MWRDRVDAGRKLADALADYKGKDALVAGIPRGGVIVAKEVADALELPLAVVITRKLSAPGNPELAIGAVAPDGAVNLDQNLALVVGASDTYIEAERRRKMEELNHRLERYGANVPEWSGRTVILIDDGVATGASIKAAAAYIRRAGAAKIVIAAPVAPPDAYRELGDYADDIVFLSTPEYFAAVGAFYRDFTQTTDEEVEAALKR